MCTWTTESRYLSHEAQLDAMGSIGFRPALSLCLHLSMILYQSDILYHFTYISISDSEDKMYLYVKYMYIGKFGIVRIPFSTLLYLNEPILHNTDLFGNWLDP